MIRGRFLCWFGLLAVPLLRGETVVDIAGTGQPGHAGDGGDGRSAQVREPISLQFAPDGQLYFCDLGNQRIRTWDPHGGLVHTVCRNGRKAAPEDGAPFSPETPLSGPRSIAFDGRGQLWIALRDTNALYRADLKQGVLHHIAGTGQSGFSGNGGPARQAQLAGPKGIAISPAGRVYLGDTENHRSRALQVD